MGGIPMMYIALVVIVVSFCLTVLLLVTLMKAISIRKEAEIKEDEVETLKVLANTTLRDLTRAHEIFRQEMVERRKELELETEQLRQELHEQHEEALRRVARRSA